MEIGRIPYTCEMRPFRDSDETTTIQWYPVPASNGALGFPTTIISRLWQASPPYYAGDPPYPDDIGEVIASPHSPWPNVTRPDADGSHVCGTAEDFLLGCRYLPDDPPVQRRDDGLPLCCGLGLIPMGGVGVGGEAEMGVVETPPDDYCETYLIQEVGATVLRVGGGNQWLDTSGVWDLRANNVYPLATQWTVFRNTIPFQAWNGQGAWDGHGSRVFVPNFGTPGNLTVSCSG